MDSYVSPKDEIWFLRVCHHISNAVHQELHFRDCHSNRNHEVVFYQCHHIVIYFTLMSATELSSGTATTDNSYL